MLRQAIFVLVLVGAAFVGGAVINGPGLAWLQRNLIGGPTIIVDGSAPPTEPARPAKTKRFPSANPPALPFNFDSASNPLPAPAPVPARPVGPSPANPAVSLTPAAPARPAANLLGLPDPTSPELASTPAPPATTTSGDPSPLPPLDLPGESTPAAKADPVARLASTGGQDAAPPAPANPGHDWTEIRLRLKALGVSRYTIDAELDGRVRFSCVIPVDGLRAVGHHFEADGDDEFQAIDATVRRIILWRATEPTRTDP